jgi:hypothetical protein
VVLENTRILFSSLGGEQDSRMSERKADRRSGVVWRRWFMGFNRYVSWHKYTYFLITYKLHNGNLAGVFANSVGALALGCRCNL